MVNCYLEAGPPHAKTQAAVIAAHGIANWASIGSGLHRGALLNRSRLYVVNGEGLYRVNSAGSATLLGSVPGSGYVFMAGDENNIAIVEPQSERLWYWNGSVVAENTDEDF